MDGVDGVLHYVAEVWSEPRGTGRGADRPHRPSDCCTLSLEHCPRRSVPQRGPVPSGGASSAVPGPTERLCSCPPCLLTASREPSAQTRPLTRPCSVLSVPTLFSFVSTFPPPPPSSLALSGVFLFVLCSCRFCGSQRLGHDHPSQSDISDWKHLLSGSPSVLWLIPCCAGLAV